MFADKGQRNFPAEPTNSSGDAKPVNNARANDLSALADATEPLLSQLKTPDAVPNTSQKIICLYHCTSPHSLPLIFRYGLYLSADRFTVFFNRPPTDWGWTDKLVALVIRTPADRIDRGRSIHPRLGFPDPVKFPAELRAELERLDAKWEPGDDSVATSEKSKELRAAVNGAHYLLEEEKTGQLRHFAPDCIDIAQSRDGNAHGRYRAIANAYLDALERNGGHPVATPIELPSLWVRTLDALSFPVRRRMGDKSDDRPISLRNSKK